MTALRKVSAYLTEEEFRRVTTAATAARMSTSAFLRLLAIASP